MPGEDKNTEMREMFRNMYHGNGHSDH
jgi:hypothetical protein